ncbi:MAG TPA: DUF4388 domain-containing protein [Thermoanaerobaculia bacterium]|jgi:hypothetical protein
MLEGEISEIDLVARLVELWREQFTGAIRFENDGIIKIVYFKGGDVLSASTNDRADSIDEILMRAGKVSREHVKQALAKRKESETLGDALLNLGFITRKELTWARRVQVVGVIRSIAAWTAGSFTIVADYLPKRDEGTLFPLPQVLVELIVTEQDRARFERAMDGGQAVFAKSADFDEVFRRLGLNEDAESIARAIDGEKNASEVATTSGHDTFNVYKLLHALATLGVLTRVENVATPDFALDDFEGAGVADAADVWAEAPAADEPMTFELDEAEAASQPTLEVPAMSFDETELLPAPELEPVRSEPPMSAWDDDDDDATAIAPGIAAVTAAAPMPAWDTPPREPLAVPMPAEIEPPVDASEEPQWGFDEAQLETARLATDDAPPPITPQPPLGVRPMRGAQVSRKERSSRGLWIALLAILLLGAAAYGAFMWWQGREETAPVAVVATKRPAPRPAAAPPVAPATETATPLTQTAPTSTTELTAGAPVAAPAVTATQAAATPAVQPPAATSTHAAAPRAPLQVTATAPPPPPAVADNTNTAMPKINAKPTGDDRSRYDAMARDYAANPNGNFTVQIQILCEAANITKAMRDGGGNVWFVPQKLGTRSCYRVYWGRYATRAEAQAAMAQIPAALRDQSAAVRAVGR